MKLLLLSILFLISLVVYASTNAIDTINPPDWQPIIGAKKNPTVSLFFDRNNYTASNSENGEYASGSMLFSSTVNVVLSVGDKKINVRSIVKNYVMDCSSGIALAYADYYYATPKPLSTSKPIAYVTRELDSAEVFSRNSLVYITLCPTIA